MWPDVDYPSTLSHHLAYPRDILFQRPLGSRYEIVDCLGANHQCICFDPFHILTNHHGWEFPRCLPDTLPCELFAGFFGGFAHGTPCASAKRRRRRITAPLAAHRQQATQRVQTRTKPLAFACGRVTYSIPSCAKGKFQPATITCDALHASTTQETRYLYHDRAYQARTTQKIAPQIPALAPPHAPHQSDPHQTTTPKPNPTATPVG